MTPEQIAKDPVLPAKDVWPTAVAETTETVEPTSPPDPVAQPAAPVRRPVPLPTEAPGRVETTLPGEHEAIARERPVAPAMSTPAPAHRGRRKSPGLAIALSLVLLGGGGHLYAGEIWKGFGLIFLLLAAETVLFGLIGSNVLSSGPGLAVTTIGYWSYVALAARDAYRTIKRQNALNGW